MNTSRIVAFGLACMLAGALADEGIAQVRRASFTPELIDGKPIPDHDTRPEFAAPAVWWNPVISPSSLMFYRGTQFPEWQGDAFITGLSSQAIVRIEFDGEKAREAERIPMGRRIRALEQAPDGTLWALEDGRPGRGGNGWLLKLTPRK